MKIHEMSHPDPFRTTTTLDEVLLDTATIIELSPQDRRIAENRYRRLKTHIEASALAPYLIDGDSLIYAQGSIATSTTIVNGTDDDERFDVDAVVEMDVPETWASSEPLDQLEKALQEFPGVKAIVRCTRCIQLQFASMHMDVTILDRRARIAGARPGEIFHSPDDGGAYRVPSNPWGFTDWFRSKVKPDQTQFADLLEKRRQTGSKRRLAEAAGEVFAKADQQDLPAAIPSRLDAQETIALKLLKRNLNLHYEELTLKRPPSIYLTKFAGDFGYVDGGLSTQLYNLALSMAETLRAHIAKGTRPEEYNPSFPKDRINDRWPRQGVDGVEDMNELAGALERLANRLQEMAAASLSEISDGIDELFGESIGKEQRRILKERYDRRDNASPISVRPRSGQIVAPVEITQENVREVPRHRFHSFVMDDDDEG
jgi:hypothetical protein